MKITKGELRQMINESVYRALNESQANYLKYAFDELKNALTVLQDKTIPWESLDTNPNSKQLVRDRLIQHVKQAGKDIREYVLKSN